MNNEQLVDTLNSIFRQVNQNSEIAQQNENKLNTRMEGIAQVILDLDRRISALEQGKVQGAQGQQKAQQPPQELWKAK
jgi:hypothetical protein